MTERPLSEALHGMVCRPADVLASFCREYNRHDWRRDGVTFDGALRYVCSRCNVVEARYEEVIDVRLLAGVDWLSL